MIAEEKAGFLLEIRPETAKDAGEIANVIALAFADDPRSDGREAEIVALMRDDSALTLSLVACIDGAVAGHIAFSEVHINSQLNSQFCDWYGLAPVSVLPEYQNQGIGSALINKGLSRLKQLGAKGCVLLGEPDYYSRFGFQSNPSLVLEGVPPEYFQALAFDGDTPNGAVKYHAAFGQCD